MEIKVNILEATLSVNPPSKGYIKVELGISQMENKEQLIDIMEELRKLRTAKLILGEK